MRWTLILSFASVLACSSAAGLEELVMRGEVAEVDLEGSLLVVAATGSDGRAERLFEVDELTEIRGYVEGNEEPVLITLADLAPGDHVQVRYERVGGKNVATRIVRRHAERA